MQNNKLASISALDLAQKDSGTLMLIAYSIDLHKTKQLNHPVNKVQMELG
jgi:hypothetical protein